MMETYISDFHTIFYIPTIQKLAFHMPHVRILGTNHCGELLRTAFKLCESFQDVLCRRDYAERLVAIFANQIQSEYYGGNRSVSIEGIVLVHFSAPLQTDINSPTLSRPCHAVFHSFLSNDSKQNAATNTAHSKLLISLLKNKQVLTTSLIKIWENTDGFAEQYRCASALYFMSVMSQTYSIIIDQGIIAPENGKEVVDGLNDVDKRYIYQLMSKVQLPGSIIFDSQIKIHTGTENKYVSLAMEFKDHLEGEHRKNGE